MQCTAADILMPAVASAWSNSVDKLKIFEINLKTIKCDGFVSDKPECLSELFIRASLHIDLLDQGGGGGAF